MHVFGRWEEAGVPGENPRIHGENMQTPHRKVVSFIYILLRIDFFILHLGKFYFPFYFVEFASLGIAFWPCFTPGCSCWLPHTCSVSVSPPCVYLLSCFLWSLLECCLTALFRLFCFSLDYLQHVWFLHSLNDQTLLFVKHLAAFCARLVWVPLWSAHDSKGFCLFILLQVNSLLWFLLGNLNVKTET